MSTAECRTEGGWAGRWRLMTVFVLSSVLNYLDRQLLPALAPLLRAEFGISGRHYGALLSAFSIPYAVAAPLAGLFVDRVGLKRGIACAVGLWSLAGAATGLMNSLAGLLACRALLGVAQAAGVPATGKVIALYLRPHERALGHALSQAGLSLGAVLAPPLAVWISVRHGWRAAFFATGMLGLLWVPLWNAFASRAPAAPASSRPGLGARQLLGERALWTLVAANLLGMTVYTLWSNWTTLFLVDAQGMRFEQTAGWAALPPLAANLGGLAGGFVSLAWMNRGLTAPAARMRTCFIAAVLLAGTALIPLAPSPALAAAGVSLSFFLSSAWSVNLYSLPLDLYGAHRAAFATSLLTAAYGLLQAAVSPLYGALADRYGFLPVCAGVSLLPLLAWWLLRLARLDRQP
ncbi:MAG: MFS transporter [Bryobacterales bacterium]|nr:MFS transporter [Bryobacteraceae bacterium]MDW8129757.1 MFS transporter [Bryobacterales bacterium]